MTKPNEPPTEANNAFRACVRRQGFTGGLLTFTCRMQFATVTEALRPGKVIVVAKQSFSLSAGKPKKIAWF